MPRPNHNSNIGFELDAAGLRQSPDHRTGVYVDAHEPQQYVDWDVAEITDIRLGNKELPVHTYRDKIIATIAENPVTIIVAETGSGKTTQVPQMLVEAGYSRVSVTQPRRVAARGAYERMRDEITEVRGMFAGDDMTSFHTAAERKGPKDAAIRVVTDGLQLVQELHDEGTRENEVLVLDEVHEWNSNVEVLVAWTKRELITNRKLRVVIMSATMDAEHLASYYAEVCDAPVPIISIPGRQYQVDRKEAPNSTVLNETLLIINQLIAEDGSLPEGPNGILVFQPGKREINDTIDSIRLGLSKEQHAKVKIFPLHAKLSSIEQDNARTEYPDCIKVVVATDVAQTSITIPDIGYVVDSGYQRRIEVDQEGTKGLKLNAISRADSSQRAGRTGRVANGQYVLTRPNATTPHVNAEDRDEYPLPEILRTDIARNMLRLKALDIEIADFDMYHKASRQIMDLAEVNLMLLDALDESGRITQIGHQMNDYPLCTSSARIMVESRRYRESTRAYLAAITASKEIGGLQYFAYNVGKRWQELTEEMSSDLLVQLDLFIASQSMNLADIKYYDLDINNVQRAHEQYEKIAATAGTNGGFLKPPTPEEREDIMRCIYAGFLTSIYEHIGDGQYVHAFNDHMPTLRELSNRSLVTGTPNYIVGDPYCVEIQDGEIRMQKQYIENVSVASVRVLGSVAASRVMWKPDGYIAREGKFFQRQRQQLFGIDLGLLQEVPAPPTPQLRETVITHAIENPGAEQKRIRKLKRELERLAHRAKDPVRQLTHDRIIGLVHEAAPHDITTPATIEDNLRATAGLTMDDFVSPERHQEIIANSPPTIEVGELVFRVKYTNGQPSIDISNLDIIECVEANEVLLADGREVMFVLKNPDGHSKKFTLSELRYRFQD